MHYRSKEAMKKEYDETKAWLVESVKIPVEEIADFFKARVDDYEEVHNRHWPGIYRTMPYYFPEHFDTLLDIGCGSGLECDVIFKEYPDIKFTGIDICGAMLDELYRRHNDKDIKLIEADYFKYAFEKKEYDVVLSTLSLHHFKFDKKKEIYKKIYKATANGGTYFEYDYMAQDEAYEKLNLDFYDKRRATFNVPDDVFVHIDLPLTINHQIELLEYAGFKNIEILNRPFEVNNLVFIKAIKK